MNTWIAVMAGGAAGSGLRYLLMTLHVGLWGILWANWLGCFLAGLLTASPLAENWKPLLTIGLLGGFTTFSAFSIETLKLAQQQPLQAAAYVLASVVGSLALAWLGYKAGQLWL